MTVWDKIEKSEQNSSAHGFDITDDIAYAAVYVCFIHPAKTGEASKNKNWNLVSASDVEPLKDLV